MHMPVEKRKIIVKKLSIKIYVNDPLKIDAIIAIVSKIYRNSDVIYSFYLRTPSKISSFLNFAWELNVLIKKLKFWKYSYK
jgi:hypothetical protein